MFKTVLEYFITVHPSFGNTLSILMLLATYYAQILLAQLAGFYWWHVVHL